LRVRLVDGAFVTDMDVVFPASAVNGVDIDVVCVCVKIYVHISMIYLHI